MLHKWQPLMPANLHRHKIQNQVHVSWTDSACKLLSGAYCSCMTSSLRNLGLHLTGILALCTGPTKCESPITDGHIERYSMDCIAMNSC